MRLNVFYWSPMRRFVAYILLTFATLVGGGYALSAQESQPELKLQADFTSLFDNKEYASMKGVDSGTLFGARLTPQVGVEWQERNQLMVGADLYQDFGHNKFLSKAKLQLYYAYKALQVKLYAGIFPRSAMRGLSTPLFFDPAYCYYNNSISGVLARYEEEPYMSYVEFAMDYTGMRTFNTREAFSIMSSAKYFFCGYYDADIFSCGYDFYMGHYAKDYNPDTIDGVVDNLMLAPYISFEHNSLCMLGSRYPLALDVRLSYVQSLQRDRIGENVWKHPFGGELYVALWWAGIELSNRLYVGKGSLLTYYNRYGSAVYHNMPIYRTEKGIYDAIALSYSQRFFDDTVGLKAGITMEYNGTGWGTRQWLQVDVALGTDISLKRSKYIE